MGVDVKKGENLAVKMKRQDLRSEELSLERGLFLPDLLAVYFTWPAIR